MYNENRCYIYNTVFLLLTKVSKKNLLKQRLDLKNMRLG